MAHPILDAILSEYQEVLGSANPESAEVQRFRQFLLLHGGVKTLEAPGGKAQIIDRPEALRCFHFSQYLDWYLTEKEGASPFAVERARAAMIHLNQWLFEASYIPVEDFEENRESILGAAEGPLRHEDTTPPEDSEEEATDPLHAIPEEKDFYVPGEYAVLLSGDFVLTRVEEGTLYGIREGDREETGHIAEDRDVATGRQIGDRVHLFLHKERDHRHLLRV